MENKLNIKMYVCLHKTKVLSVKDSIVVSCSDMSDANPKMYKKLGEFEIQLEFNCDLESAIGSVDFELAIMDGDQDGL